MGVLNVLLLPGGGHLRGLIGMESLQPLHPFLLLHSSLPLTFRGSQLIRKIMLGECAGLWGTPSVRNMFRESICELNMFSYLSFFELDNKLT